MDPLIARLGLALAIGLLVGLERGWRERDAPDGARTAGIRTYAITGLLGGLFAALAKSVAAPSVLIAGLLAFTAVFAWYKSREAIQDADFSVTGVVAALGVFVLGALAVAGDHRAAAAGGTALAVLLASRDLLHGLLRRLSWIELRAALVLAVMTAIILPLLPAQAIDPWGGFNPQQIWLFTVLTAAISFLGYIAVRLFGTTRGVLVGGLAGAVVSSTAVTLALARTATAGVAGLAILAAVLTFVMCGGVFLSRGAVPTDAGQMPRNPFELWALLAFAILFAVVSTISAAVSVGNTGGMVVTSAITGTFDIDVAVLSALRLLGVSADRETVGHAVLLALTTNAAGRLVVAAGTGPVRFWLPIAVATITAVGLGFLVFATLPHFDWPGTPS